MAGQALHEFNVKSSQPFMLRDVVPDPAWALYRAPVRAFPWEREFRYEEDLEDGSCLKGALVGLCLEGAVALAVYGTWQLWHVLG